MKRLFDIYILITAALSILFGVILFSEFLFRKNIYLDEKVKQLSLFYKTELIANKKISEALFDDILLNGGSIEVDP